MMKYVTVLVLIAVAAGLPVSDITLLSSNNDNQGDGNYNYEYKTSDGAAQQASGSLKPNSDPKAEFPQFQVAQGSYSYPVGDGKIITVTYTADENGYRSRAAYSR